MRVNSSGAKAPAWARAVSTEDLFQEGVNTNVSVALDILADTTAALGNMLRREMPLESLFARPFLNEGEVSWIVRVVKQLVCDTAILGTRGLYER